MKKNKKWTKARHRIARNIAYAILYPYAKLKYRIKVDRFREQGKRPYLILLNHQTPFDQFFVGMSFTGAVYYVATEDIFSNGWISSLIRFLAAPIPIKKQTTDITAVINCIKVAREGGTIAMAPEGNRTYSGKTGYMNPSVAPLARKLGLPVALYRIEGGYGCEPRWSDVVRRGRMHAYVSRVIEPEEYAKMSDDELLNEIREGLFVDENNSDGLFLSKKSAEYLERAIYVCPKCGLSEFESRGKTFRCKKCGLRVEYGADKRLSSPDPDFAFSFIGDWYDYQEKYVSSLDLSAADSPLFTDSVSVKEVIINKRKRPVRKSAPLLLYADRVETEDENGSPLVFPFSDSGAAVLGRNKLNIYRGGRAYQFKGGKRFCALKYVNFLHKYKNTVKGKPNEQFLGL